MTLSHVATGNPHVAAHNLERDRINEHEMKFGMLVPFWQPNTQYHNGDIVVNPAGQIITATSDFTSGDVYAGSAHWTVTTTSSAITGDQITTGNIPSGVMKQALLSLGVPFLIVEASGSYASRPAYAGVVIYIGADAPTSGGTTAGGAGAVNGLDLWFKTGT